ncbi:MAG: Gfo/Idh/MocA family oxidoreductase [Rhizobiaceae bacterium]
MFRWGVLSTAKIGREHVLPAIAESANGVVSAVASRDPSRARDLADRFGAPHAFGSYDELLESDAVDGVYVPLPTAQHAQWAAKAARAGKHVLVEKPLALDAADIAPLIALRDARAVLIAEAFMVAYHPQWSTVRDLIAAGALGKLRQVQAAFTYHNVDPANMRNRPELGGGALRDIGVYPVVAASLATGREPVRVQAVVERDPRFGTDRHASVRVDFGDFELSFYVGTQMAARQAMLFHGDAGTLELAAPFQAGIYDQARLDVFDRKRTQGAVHRFPGVNQYRLQAEAFVRAARGEDVQLFTLEQSVLNQRVIDAIFRAGDSGGWERV